MNGQSVNEVAFQLEEIMDEQGDFMEEAEVEETLDEEVETEEETEEVESEEEETEESEEEDGEETEEETEEVESEEEALFELTIDGEVYEVNEEELRSGYLRNEQLVKRQSELEAEYQEKLSALEDDRSKLLEELQVVTLETNVGLRKFENLNWQQLKATDPEGYKEALVEFAEARQAAAHQEHKRQQLVALNAEAQRIRHDAYLKQQQKVAMQLIPEIAEEGFADSLVAYGKSIGFTEEDIRSISDAKAIFILNQARLYAESKVKQKAAKEKLSKDLPPVIKPGAPKTKSQEEGRKSKALRSKFNQSHDLRDAAAVLLEYV